LGSPFDVYCRYPSANVTETLSPHDACSNPAAVLEAAPPDDAVAVVDDVGVEPGAALEDGEAVEDVTADVADEPALAAVVEDAAVVVVADVPEHAVATRVSAPAAARATGTIERWDLMDGTLADGTC
jgi:hypothetical protein